MGIEKQLDLSQELAAAGSREDALKKTAKLEEPVEEKKIETAPTAEESEPTKDLNPTEAYWRKVFPPDWKQKEKETENKPKPRPGRKVDENLIDYKSRQYKD